MSRATFEEAALAAFAELTPDAEPCWPRRQANVRKALAARLDAEGLDAQRLTGPAKIEVRVQRSRGGMSPAFSEAGKLYVLIGHHSGEPTIRIDERKRGGIEIERVVRLVKQRQELGLRSLAELDEITARGEIAESLSEELGLRVCTDAWGFSVLGLTESQVRRAAAALKEAESA